MRIISARLAAAALCLAILAGPVAAQDKRAIAGTTVSLSVPAGFEPASGFAGLQNLKTKASVMIVEMPAEAHAQISTLFANLDSAKTNFARQNVVIEDREEIETAAGTVPVLSGSQQAGGVSFDKWIALFKGTKTVLITVQAPNDSDLDDDEVHALLKSVSLGAEPSLADKLGALPFSVTAAEPFRVIDTIGGSGVLMMAGPLNTDPSGKQPLLIVAAQLSGPRDAKIEDLSAALLKQTRSLETATVTKREARAFAGGQGHLLAGTNPEGKRFEQYLGIGSDGRFVRLVAIAEADAFDRLKPTIEAIAASVAFKPAR